MVAARAAWRALSPTRRRLGVDAHARFATRRELRPLLVKAPVPGRFVLGTWGRWLVATESQRWAPNRKRGLAPVVGVRHRRASATAVPVTSRRWRSSARPAPARPPSAPSPACWTGHGPAILLSVKRDLMDTTIARRRQLGEVRVFDPGGFLQHNQNPDVDVAPAERARWSPLRNAHTATGAKRAGEALAAWTPQAGVEGGMSFWTTQGKLLFTGLLGAAGFDAKRSMREVAQWVFNMSMPGDGMPACRAGRDPHRGDRRPGPGPSRRRRGGDPASGGDLEQARPEDQGVGVLDGGDGVRPVARPARRRRHRPRPTTTPASGSTWTG